MAKVIGAITARIASKRLPGKIMKKIAGKTMFEHHVERMKAIQGIDGVFLATSENPLNKELIKEAERLGCGWYAGAEQDVIERHVELCKREKADAVIRVPCDSPLFDIESCARFIKEFKKEYRDYMYVSNMTMIQGTVKELISYQALCRIHKVSRGPAVSLYIIENMEKFNTLGFTVDADLSRPEYRLTVDYQLDFELMCKIYDALYKGKPLSLRDVYVWLDDNPQIAMMNKDVAVSGINQYIGNMMDKQLYSIVMRGKNYQVLDEKKMPVPSGKFLKKVLEFFPELRKTGKI
ncbi:MAG: NTP transferase domain-containing protein [Candidatus Omnitrophica bacterium]|nr:NTP transferase domain-containing protein [Candidatus Omnitrophota bacterium]